VATWDDVRRLAGALPETTESDRPVWSVRGKAFAMRRPLRTADRAFLGAAAPLDDPLGAWVADLDAKDALLVGQPDVYLTTPHFDGYPVVLARLERLDVAGLEELLVGSWVARAPKRLARAFLAQDA
jgi:hypothetical protein